VSHWHNLIIIMGGGGAKLTVDVRSQVRKRRKIGLYQPLIYVHPFLPL